MKYKNTCRLAGVSSAFMFLLSCSLEKINKDQNEYKIYNNITL